MPSRLLTSGGGAVRLLAVLLAMLSGCAPAMRSTAERPLTQQGISPLWVEPDDIASRDLYHGPGGAQLEPREGATFIFEELDTTGFSRGYDVEDDAGLEWSVKLGPEAQSEVVASRLLWAVGYHQPPTYFVRQWSLTGGPAPGPQPPARFRPDPPGTRTIGDWSWQQNPFVDTRPFKALIALNLLVNNWDLKGTNNKIYEIARGGAEVRRQYVVRDLGASFGKSRWFPYGTRNDIDDFERQAYVRGVSNGQVRFDYSGRHRELLEHIAPEDVIWACQWMAKLTDAQLDDAFRAGGYDQPTRDRFIRKLKAKVAQGLALRAAAGEGRPDR